MAPNLAPRGRLLITTLERAPSLRLVAVAALAGLAACNSTVLDSSIGTASTSPGGLQPALSVGAQTPPDQRMAAQPPASGGQQVASVQKIPPVAFLPVTGAPQPAVQGLATAMRQAAKANGVPVVVSVNNGARYQVKGYFSALNDSSGSVIVYVWDVLDAKGVRVHRISGQERGGKSSGDPWNGISQDVLTRVATTTMRSLRQWELNPTSG